MPKRSEDAAKALKVMQRTGKKAMKTAKDKPPVRAGQQLPGGLVNAVAKFKTYTIGVDKNGNPYVLLTGTCIKPEEHQGARVQRSHFLNESEWSTLQECYDYLYSDLQLLGIDTEDVDDPEELEKALNKLEKETPYFTFNTTKKENKETRIYIQQLLSDEAAAELDDEEEPEPDEEEEEYEEEEDPEEEEEEYEDEEGEEEEKEYEEEEGEEEEEDPEEEEEDEEDEDGEWSPAIGDVYGYKPPRGKVGDCEVIGVDEEAETVSLQRVSDDKQFDDVSWDALLDA